MVLFGVATVHQFYFIRAKLRLVILALAGDLSVSNVGLSLLHRVQTKLADNTLTKHLERIAVRICLRHDPVALKECEM